MDKYILLKDLPQCKAGTTFIKYSEMAVDYLARGVFIPSGPCGKSDDEFFLHDKFVEDNPEWFRKEPELKWYVIPSDVHGGWRPKKQHEGNMAGYAGTKYFDSEKDAVDFIIMNKPCLSLNDIVNGLVPAWINNHYLSQLKELVKSKL